MSLISRRPTDGGESTHLHRAHTYTAKDLSQHTDQTPDSLASSSEAATVHESLRQQQKRHSPLSAEIYTKTPDKRVSKQPARPSPLLKAIGDLYIAKEVLRAQNAELTEQVELHSERNRKSSLEWQKTHREEYNAYQREYMREYRARKKQQAQPPSE
jgi:hypothetical protein